jgi:hypothetical protein
MTSLNENKIINMSGNIRRRNILLKWILQILNLKINAMVT